MKVMVPRIDAEGQRTMLRPQTGQESMLERYKAAKNDADVTILKNKPPKWNDQVGAYVLNFNGRVTRASVKNFQLCDLKEERKPRNRAQPRATARARARTPTRTPRARPRPRPRPRTPTRTHAHTPTHAHAHTRNAFAPRSPSPPAVFRAADTVIMQFGRVGKDAFTMDFQHPLCALQAFGIALSSFDYKIACE